MIYIEQIIFIDLLIHHMFLYLTNLLTINNINKLRLLMSDILNIILIILYIYFNINIKIEILFIFLISLISFNIKNVLSIMIYMMLNASLGGIANIIYLNYNYHYQYLYILIIVYLIIVFLYKVKYKNIPKISLYYTILIKDINIRINAYLDTGNLLVDNNKEGILILNTKYKSDLFINNGYINISTINDTLKEECFKCKNLYIKYKRKYHKFKGSIIFKDINQEGIIGLKSIGG